MVAPEPTTACDTNLKPIETGFKGPGSGGILACDIEVGNFVKAAVVVKDIPLAD
jgi:hypothetical protein